MNLTEVLLRALKDCGAREIFGIPGDFALPYFKVIESSAILPLFTLGHEPAVGFAADASARFAGGLGVAAVTYGAGALNMVNAIAQAYAEKSPVVVISGAPGKAETARGLLLHHQAKTISSQFRIYQEITCDQAVLNDPLKAPAKIARVLQNCLEQSRPIYIEIPRDLAQVECEPVPAFVPLPFDPEAVEECADDILVHLATANSPMLMVGVEVRRYGLEEQVKELADRLGIPVANSFMGSGLLIDSDKLAGTYLGAAGAKDLTEAVESSDALVLLGVILSDTNFGISAGRIDMRKAIHIEGRQVRMGFHLYPEIPLRQLIEALLAKCRPLPHKSRLLELRQTAEYGGLVADEAAIAPDDIACALNDLIRERGPLPIASDIGDCLFTILGIRPTPIAAPGYFASMGFGVPAGLGIQATTGERTLILVGDGAFQMTGMELGHCARLGLDPVVLVFNNRTWGMLAVFEPEARYNDLGEWNFARLAGDLGGDGYRVASRRELQAALARALATRGRFQLIEIMMGKEQLSSTLNNYVNTLRRLNAPKG